jgi:hypothetical protein
MWENAGAATGFTGRPPSHPVDLDGAGDGAGAGTARRRR